LFVQTIHNLTDTKNKFELQIYFSSLEIVIFLRQQTQEKTISGFRQSSFSGMGKSIRRLTMRKLGDVVVPKSMLQFESRPTSKIKRLSDKDLNPEYISN